MKVKSPIYYKDMQRFLDECIITREPVSIVALTSKGELIDYSGWLVISTWWQGGTVNLLNLRSGEKRKARTILIMKVNDHPVYL